MNVISHTIRFAAACVVLTLAACGGGSSGSGSGGGGAGGGQPPVGTVVGAAGGTVLGPNGAKVVIPPGALATDTTINIAQIAASATALPSGFTVLGQMFAFTPHGTTFAVPVTVTLPFDPALVPAGTTAQFYKTNAQSQWEQIANAAFGAGTATAQVTSFSDATVAVTSLLPARFWSFAEFRGDMLERVELATEDVKRTGLVEEFFEFGPTTFDMGYRFEDGTELPPDGIATGRIGSTADGKTYWVGTDSPRGVAVLPAELPQEPIGSEALLIQQQSFIKNADNATYEFTLNKVIIEVRDGNSVLGRACPPVHSLGGVACDLIKGEVFLDVTAKTDPVHDVPPLLHIPDSIVFFHIAGGASLNGGAAKNTLSDLPVSWLRSAWNASNSRIPLWTSEDFDFVAKDFNGREGHLRMELRKPLTYRVDLSHVGIGKAFQVLTLAVAMTYDRAAASVSGKGTEFGTGASAFLRDPLSIGGITVATTGLTPIATTLPALPLATPVEVPVAPAACVPGPGPDPAAGVLQFSAASFNVAEASTTPTVTVTRTGGSRGAVTATFITRNGSAISGTDYTPVNASVFFADGDAVPRVVRVPIIQDLISGEPDKTVNLTLSQPGGCAALGAQTSAVLTIRDDDVPPPSPRFTVGGTVKGLIGTRLVLIDHHSLTLRPGNGPFTFSNIPSLSGEPYSVRIDLNPINPTQVCTVTNGSGTFTNANVTNVQVNCV